MLQKKILLLGLILMLIASKAEAQRFVTTNDFDRLSKVTFGPSINSYFGELRRFKDPNLQLGLGFGLGYEHLMTDNIALRTKVAVYTIKADDALSSVPANQTRNLNFKSTNLEFVVEGMYYIYRHPKTGYRDRPLVSPYFHLGIGVTSNNPQATLKSGTPGTYKMRPLSIEGEQYGSLAFIVPVGVGIDLYVSREIDIQFDLSYSVAFTGYLDDVSGTYRDQASFTDTNGLPASLLAELSDPRTVLDPPVPAVAAGTRRGDGTNDGYLRLGIKVGYYLPKSLYGKSSIRCRVLKKTR
jgi:hypothetical protein